MKILKNVCLIIHIVPFLWLQIFEIWVYIENVCLIIHIVPFLWLQILKYWYTREYISYYSHCSFIWLQIFEIWVYKGMKILFLLVT